MVNRIKHTELIIAFFFARDQFTGFSGSSGPFQSTTTNDCWREAVEPPVSVELEDPGGVRLLGSLLLRGLENILNDGLCTPSVFCMCMGNPRRFLFLYLLMIGTFNQEGKAIDSGQVDKVDRRKK